MENILKQKIFKGGKGDGKLSNRSLVKTPFVGRLPVSVFLSEFGCSEHYSLHLVSIYILKSAVGVFVRLPLQVSHSPPRRLSCLLGRRQNQNQAWKPDNRTFFKLERRCCSTSSRIPAKKQLKSNPNVTGRMEKNLF